MQRLELLRRGGKIRAWRYEEKKLRLGDGCWYLPDFWVMTNDGFIEYHEVKGFMREAGRTKFLAAAAKFTEYTWIMVRKTRAGWETIYEKGAGEDES